VLKVKSKYITYIEAQGDILKQVQVFGHVGGSREKTKDILVCDIVVAEVSMPTTGDHLARLISDSIVFKERSYGHEQGSEQRKAACARFVQHYGTDFVHSVKVGGRVYITQSRSTKKGGLGGSVQAPAAGGGGGLVVDLLKDREDFTLMFIGGDTSLLGAAYFDKSAPSLPAQTAYEQWIASVPGQPAVIEQNTMELEALFTRFCIRDKHGGVQAVSTNSGSIGQADPEMEMEELGTKFAKKLKTYRETGKLKSNWVKRS